MKDKTNTKIPKPIFQARSRREITHPVTKTLTSTLQTPIHILRHVLPGELQSVNIWVMFDRLEFSQVDGLT